MLNSLIELYKSEDGAVTVDWVVLTAAVAGLGNSFGWRRSYLLI